MRRVERRGYLLPTTFVVWDLMSNNARDNHVRRDLDCFAQTFLQMLFRPGIVVVQDGDIPSFSLFGKTPA
jgi:hypothetical protein